MKKFIHGLTKRYTLLLLVTTFTACEDFVTIDPPRTALVKTTVFDQDDTAEAALLDLYFQLRNLGFASGTNLSVSYLASLSSDEQISYYVGPGTGPEEFSQFNQNTLLPANSFVFRLWADLYSCIYKANAVLEGISSSTGMSEDKKKLLTAEAKFIRAFCNFYLVNLWGDVPHAISTNYQVNASITRTNTTVMYQQILSDLTEAKSALPDDYAHAGNERIRANKSVTNALLARAYLYTNDWQQAITASTEVINTSLFELLPNLNGVFLVNSKEAILQWWSNKRANERDTFRFLNTPSNGALRPELVAAFETGDNRKTVWTSLRPTGLYSTQKYISITSNPPTEYSTVFRLAEQFLIRAEAHTQLGDLPGAQADLNKIRNRAGLANTTASTKADLLLAIEKERRVEFFNEWGHRWFDLKRTGRAEAVLTPLKPQWKSTAQRYPIPESEINNNIGLQNAQNQGY
ncbi:MAG: RagB/SusD family nutrient uptake outer membrane protein [Cyclobacteriaceae bacterium]